MTDQPLASNDSLRPARPEPKPVVHLEPSTESASVELEPLSLHPESPRYVPGNERAPRVDGDYGQGIPEKPLHVCPECDYILTGLTSRRCPECGTPFTLAKARQRAIELTPKGREDTQAIRAEQIMLYVGVGLLLLSTLGPIVWHGMGTTLGGFWLVSVNATIVVVACMMKGYFDLRWGSAILCAGLVTAGIAALVVLL